MNLGTGFIVCNYASVKRSLSDMNKIKVPILCIKSKGDMKPRVMYWFNVVLQSLWWLQQLQDKRKSRIIKRPTSWKYTHAPPPPLPSQYSRRGRRGWRCGCSSSWMDGGHSPWQQSWVRGQSMRMRTGAEGRKPCQERPLRWACTCCFQAKAAGGRVDLKRHTVLFYISSIKLTSIKVIG